MLPLRAIVTAMLFAAGVGLVPTVLAMAPHAASQVAVVAPPWANPDDAARMVAAADGAIVATARDGYVVIARFDAGDFVSRLYQAGALLVIDATIVTACLRIRNRPAPGAST